MKKIEGIVCHSSLPKGKTSSILEIHDSEITSNLVIDGNTTVYRLPIKNLSIKKGGAGNAFIFLRNSLSPDTTFYMNKNTGILNVLSSYQDNGIQDQLKIIKNKRNKFSVLLSILTLFSLLVLIIVYSQRQLILESIIGYIPFEVEKKIGDNLVPTLLKQSTIINKEHEAYKEFIKITDYIFRDGKYKKSDFSFYLVKSPEVNAFALPGGHIVFYTGLLTNADSVEEVLGVMSHEMAHVYKRHILKNIVGSIGIYLIIQTFWGDISGIITLLKDNGNFLLNQKFSRDYEFEADQEGFKQLVDAKISPLGMASFFERLLNRKETKSKIVNELVKNFKKHLSILSTHPNLEQRIKITKNRFDDLSVRVKNKLRPLDYNYKKYKKILKSK